MNWDNKNWSNEDLLYGRKRNVQNKISWRMPHIIGSFYSYKLNRIVEYQSLGELLFYFLLELDRQTIRYYVQPIKVSIKQINDAGEIWKENLILMGGVGTGKTHMATALAVEACRRGIEVKFFRVSELVDTLKDRFTQGSLRRFTAQLKKSELLILDEVGYVPFEQVGSELLFNVIADCYERQSIIITTNLEFSQWSSVFGDTKLTSALVDRLVHYTHIITFTGDSNRLAEALKRMNG